MGKKKARQQLLTGFSEKISDSSAAISKTGAERSLHLR
ncbi:MAG: hypothetical protein ACI8UO_004941 [Verrucomicrobiales bacterium]|jgi:hypothetical protein